MLRRNGSLLRPVRVPLDKEETPVIATSASHTITGATLFSNRTPPSSPPYSRKPAYIVACEPQQTRPSALISREFPIKTPLCWTESKLKDYIISREAIDIGITRVATLPMDSITHLTNKLLAERARQQKQTPAEPAPPPYSADDDESDSEEEEDEPALPTKLTINAAHYIQGCNNLVPTSLSPLADATKFSSILLHAIDQINAASAAANGNASCSSNRGRSLKVDLTINCGITVVGDRNVIGNVGLKLKTPAESTIGCSATVAGAKRKADGTPNAEEEPAAKKIAAVVD